MEGDSYGMLMSKMATNPLTRGLKGKYKVTEEETVLNNILCIYDTMGLLRAEAPKIVNLLKDEAGLWSQL